MSERAGKLDRPDGEEIAWRRIDGEGPAVVWLGGFRSDMAGTKAQALADWATASGRAYVRFDYLGHGESSGDFGTKGTITRWREKARAKAVRPWIPAKFCALCARPLNGQGWRRRCPPRR